MNFLLTKNTKILILSGSSSGEEYPSKLSADGSFESLKEAGYKNVEILFFDKKNEEGFIEQIKQKNPQVCLNMMHGGYGEDGQIQSKLNELKIPYTHSGKRASEICMNKVLVAKICEENEIEVNKNVVVTKEDILTKKYTQLMQDSGLFAIANKFIIKPVLGGSSVGVFSFEKNLKDEDVETVKNLDFEEYIIEEFLFGSEYTVCFFTGHYGVIGADFKEELLDYKTKYTEGSYKHVIEPEIDFETRKKMISSSKKIIEAVGVKDVCRIDFRLKIYPNLKTQPRLLDVNTHPGYTPLSFMPDFVRSVGISYLESIELLLMNAVYEK